jgi:hypothetical protein
MRADDFMSVEANDCPMSSCAAPAGSPCRTGRGRVAAQYHTARFRLVPRFVKALAVPVPPVRRPGSARTELPRPASAGTAPAGHVRIGYDRASTVRQSLGSQADSLRAAGVTRVFAEKISTRAFTRPELDRAVAAWWSHEQACVSEGTCPHCPGPLAGYRHATCSPVRRTPLVIRRHRLRRRGRRGP